MTQKILVYSSQKKLGFTCEALNGYPTLGTDPISHLGTDPALSFGGRLAFVPGDRPYLTSYLILTKNLLNDLPNYEV